MKDQDAHRMRRLAKKQVRFAKHGKGFMSGEKANQIEKAIQNTSKHYAVYNREN